MLPLFKKYPLLINKLNYISFSNFPTPINKLEKLGEKINCSNLYIKRDDVSGSEYGGNKIRKLEFLIGEAIYLNKKAVLTFGYAGSNHALATAIYAKLNGLKSFSMLLPQSNAKYVRDNLLASYLYGAELHQQNNIILLALDTLLQILKIKIKTKKFPLIIPPGGSSIYGIIGFINAAFELKEQIDNGEIQKPDFIYIPLGSGGTAAGLTLGFKVLNLDIKIISVRVAEEKYANKEKIIKLFNKTNKFLNNIDNSFPIVKIKNEDIIIRHDYYGQHYAVFTESDVKAMKLIKETENIILEGTYTGKTLDALISDIKKFNLYNKTILFWNTYNSINFKDKIKNINYTVLPKKLHFYFKNNVQPLDINDNL